MQIPDTLILCGGKGERLHPLTLEHQKCMLPVCGKPYMEYMVDKIKGLELGRIIFCCGHAVEEVLDYFMGKNYKFSYCANINTGARVLTALSLVMTKYLVVFNGDSYCNLNYNHFWYAYKEFINSGKESCKFLIDKDNSLLASHINPKYSSYGAGIYLFKKEYLSSLEYDDNLSIEDDIIPNSNCLFYNLPKESFVIDIGTPENLKIVQNMGEFPCKDLTKLK
jgi:NDP-sugar pyrophosphorylase family protein